MPRGRPPVKDKVRVNWTVKKTTETAIRARIIKGGKPNSPGAVLDEEFKQP